MKNQVVGVEIGSGAVRIVTAIPDRFPIVTGVHHLPFHGLRHGALEEQQVLVATLLKDFVKQHDLVGLPTVFSVPSEFASLYWTKLPKVRREELAELAIYKLKDQLVGDSSDLSVGVVPVSVDEHDNYESLVISIPKGLVRERADAIIESGLVPAGCELEAQSLLRLMQHDLESMSSLARQMSMTLVDIGLERTRFLVMQNLRLQFVRGIRFGARRVLEAIAEQGGFSEVEAAEILDSGKAKLTLTAQLEVEHNGNHVTYDLKEPMESLIRELQRLSSYFRTLKSDRSYSGILERLVLAGELVSVEGFAEFIGKMMHTRIQLINPFDAARLEIDIDQLDSVSKTPHRFAVATGLALSPYTLKKENSHGRRATDAIAA